MESLKIWLITIGATVTYGIAHDLVTTRVSLEYFTIAHAGIFTTQSPTLLAFGWGIVATWWVGVLLGGIIALAARFGGRPKVLVRDVIRPGVRLVLGVGLLSFLAGLGGFIAASAGVIALNGGLAADIPPDAHARLLAVAWAQTAAYGTGFVGAMLFAAWIWLKRARATSSTVSVLPSPSARAA